MAAAAAVTAAIPAASVDMPPPPPEDEGEFDEAFMEFVRNEPEAEGDVDGRYEDVGTEDDRNPDEFDRLSDGSEGGLGSSLNENLGPRRDSPSIMEIQKDDDLIQHLGTKLDTQIRC